MHEDGCRAPAGADRFPGAFHWVDVTQIPKAGFNLTGPICPNWTLLHGGDVVEERGLTIDTMGTDVYCILWGVNVSDSRSMGEWLQL